MKSVAVVVAFLFASHLKPPDKGKASWKISWSVWGRDVDVWGDAVPFIYVFFVKVADDQCEKSSKNCKIMQLGIIRNISE